MTTKKFKPMLAETVDDPASLNYPVLVSPKLDGIRALVRDGVVVSRSLKPIPNKQVQAMFGKPEYNGFDGELMVGSATASDAFNVTTSHVMSHDKESDSLTYQVFDDITQPGLPFRTRLEHAHQRIGASGKNSGLVFVPHVYVVDANHLESTFKMAMTSGYEGAMVRDPAGPYKNGRSTVKQGWLLKIKLFEDAEAEIIGFDEQMHNANEAKTDALGHTERSTAQDGLVPMGTMGALKVRDLKTEIEFEIGTGFTQAQRQEIWDNRDQYKGKLAKYRHQPYGRKDKPRFPSFLGLRDPIDM